MATTAPMFLELDEEERESKEESESQQNAEGNSSDGSNTEEYHRIGRKVLMAAEKNRLVSLVQYINQHPTLVNYADSDGYTPLHRAAYGGHIDSAKYLVRHGANLEAKTSDDWRPLHCAVRWNNVEVAEYLVRQGANVNAKSSGNNTPLHIVASNGHYSLTCDIIQMLLFHPDCDYTTKNNSGDTAYDLAKRSGPFYRFWNGIMTLPRDNTLEDST